jgi:GrpB-like predicted nucleotidyltransferase (UPF0157 family)
MPPPIPVVLVKYDPAWPKRAEFLSGKLQPLGPLLISVHHIGSTAVPGLCAKPIIDLMPVVSSEDALDRIRGQVEDLGFQWHGDLGIPGRRYCTLTNDKGIRIAQLHFFSDGSPHIQRHLAFRDYLRAHQSSVADYEKEKKRARDLHPNDSHAYSDEKAPWVKSTEAKALRWFLNS